MTTLPFDELVQAVYERKGTGVCSRDYMDQVVKPSLQLAERTMRDLDVEVGLRLRLDLAERRKREMPVRAKP